MGGPYNRLSFLLSNYDVDSYKFILTRHIDSEDIWSGTVAIDPDSSQIKTLI